MDNVSRCSQCIFDGVYAPTSVCLPFVVEEQFIAADQALRLYETLSASADPEHPLSHKVAIDLAHACIASGDVRRTWRAPSS